MVLNKFNLDNWGIGSASDYCKLWLPMSTIYTATNVYTPDLSGNNHPAQLYGDTKLSMIKNGGKAMALDGTTDYLLISDHADLNLSTTDFTLSLWIKSSVTNRIAIAKQTGVSSGGWELTNTNGTQYQFYDRFSSIGVTSVDGTNTNWNMITLVRTSGSMIIYHNMNPSTQVTLSGNLDNTGALSIGAYNTGAYATQGYIYSVLLFNGIALTRTQISTLYNATYIE